MLRRYDLEIHTEELRGRMSASRSVRFNSLEEAEEGLLAEWEAYAMKHHFLRDVELSDGTWLIEYQNKMRTTFKIKAV